VQSRFRNGIWFGDVIPACPLCIPQINLCLNLQKPADRPAQHKHHYRNHSCEPLSHDPQGNYIQQRATGAGHGLAPFRVHRLLQRYSQRECICNIHH